MTDDQIRLICAIAIHCAHILAGRVSSGTTGTLTEAVADVTSIDHTLRSTKRP